jgi:glycosyltransferase involved in cell wall biosynthesis
VKFLFLLYSHEKGLAADGGGFRTPFLLGEAFAGMGHQVHVVAPRPPFRSPFPMTPFPVLDLPLLRPLAAYGFQFLLAAWRILRDRPDVIYFRSSLTPGPVLLGRIFGVRTMMEVNGDAAFEAARDGQTRRARLIRFVEGFNARRADRIFALTDGLADMLVENYGAPRERISVIPSGTDAVRMKPRPVGECRRELGLPDAPTVGFLGIFYHHQGVDALLKAAPAVLARQPRARSLLVGDGPARAEWEKLAGELGIAASVDFSGQVPFDRVPVYLGAMDVVAAPFHPNRGETSPLKVLDACAAGRPVVLHRLPSLKVLEEAIPALRFVAPGDPGALAAALLELLEDPATRERLGRESRAAVQDKFDWTRIARRCVEMFS